MTVLQFVLLKGVAALRFYGGDAGLRPMGDSDLLVPRADAARASDALLAEHWMPSPICTPAQLHGRIYDNHGWNFRRGDAEIDLHWHGLHQELSPFFDRHLWRHRQTAVLARQEMFAFHVDIAAFNVAEIAAWFGQERGRLKIGIATAYGDPEQQPIDATIYIVAKT